jgi:hypothetical protein
MVSTPKEGIMPGWLKGLLTVVLWTFLPAGVLAAVLGASHSLPEFTWLVLLVGGFGLLYGLEAGILTSYDLGSPLGWLELLVDMTWSAPNTVWGFVLGNLIFWFAGTPSRADSADAGWIVFKPRSSTGFGHSVKQTHGTLNLGGAGQHEKMHLLQARIFGPAFLPLYLACYAVTVTIQVLWTITLGWILVLAKVRQKAPLQPPTTSVVSGFFGWIYYATLFELWAYASGNP